jgi:hypothetical protein
MLTVLHESVEVMVVAGGRFARFAGDALPIFTGGIG